VTLRTAAAVLLLAAVVWMTLLVTLVVATDAYDATARVTQHDTYDPSGIQFFEFQLDGTRVVLSVDADAPLARWLQRRTRVRLSLTAIEPQELSR
jgi:hypothetical protein